MPTPQQGDLPLPQGLPPTMLECNPQAVEDLNAVVPQGAQQLSSQELNEHVSFQELAIYYAQSQRPGQCSHLVGMLLCVGAYLSGLLRVVLGEKVQVRVQSTRSSLDSDSFWIDPDHNRMCRPLSASCLLPSP